MIETKLLKPVETNLSDCLEKAEKKLMNEDYVIQIKNTSQFGSVSAMHPVLTWTI